MRRKAKIIATLGPSSQGKNTLIKMVQAGMDVARLNFSHGNYVQFGNIIRRIKEINHSSNAKVRILQDLEGQRIRIGYLKKSRQLKVNEQVGMCNEATTIPNLIPLEFDQPMKTFRKGMDVYIDDGKLLLRVTKSGKEFIRLKVIHGGILKSRKGVNIPGLKLTVDLITKKDMRDIEFGIKQKVNMMALSFVQNAEDMIRLREIVKPRLPRCLLIAKIEDEHGVRNIDKIIDASDGIMVARGDLGVSIPVYKLPVIQKQIVRKCNKVSKFVIVATQMLESMVEFHRPTRADVSDVADAVYSGANFVMLSRETTVGSYPVDCVRMMREIIEFMEDAIRKKSI
jgi:pyruvate kinase